MVVHKSELYLSSHGVKIDRNNKFVFWESLNVEILDSVEAPQYIANKAAL